MGLRGIPMRADTGPIGGDLSHEFLVQADTGESEIACHKDLAEFDVGSLDLDSDSDLEAIVGSLTGYYAATDEKRDPEIEKSLGDDLVIARGIEVGHILYFGAKYSIAMDAAVAGPNDEPVHAEMGS